MGESEENAGKKKDVALATTGQNSGIVKTAFLPY